MVKSACPTCAKNQDAFEVVSLRLWEARLQIEHLKDLIERLNDDAFRVHELEQDIKLALIEVDRCRRDHA